MVSGLDMTPFSCGTNNWRTQLQPIRTIATLTADITQLSTIPIAKIIQRTYYRQW